MLISKIYSIFCRKRSHVELIIKILAYQLICRRCAQNSIPESASRLHFAFNVIPMTSYKFRWLLKKKKKWNSSMITHSLLLIVNKCKILLKAPYKSSAA